MAVHIVLVDLYRAEYILKSISLGMTKFQHFRNSHDQAVGIKNFGHK